MSCSLIAAARVIEICDPVWAQNVQGHSTFRRQIDRSNPVRSARQTRVGGRNEEKPGILDEGCLFICYMLERVTHSIFTLTSATYQHNIDGRPSLAAVGTESELEPVFLTAV